MKKRLTLLYMVCCLAFSAMAQKQVVILHTNDTHSCVMPLNPHLADTTVADCGGYLRRVVMVKQERKANPDLLLFDSGDFSQGSPYYTLFKGDVEVGLMNEMKYDAATIGNHEFDFGIDNMARLFKLAKFPIVCSNYDFTGTPLDGLVKPWIILERNGLKIGVFALCPKLDGLVSKANYGSIQYLDPVSKGLELSTFLKKKKKCDVVICLSHLGWNEGEGGDPSMIAGSRYVDLVLGGHSHTYFRNLEYVTDLDGKKVPVDQNGKNAIWVGKMVLDLVKK